MDISTARGRSCRALSMPCDDLTLSLCKAPGLGLSAEPHAHCEPIKMLTVKARTLIAWYSSGLSDMARVQCGVEIPHIKHPTDLRDLV